VVPTAPLDPWLMPLRLHGFAVFATTNCRKSDKRVNGWIAAPEAKPYRPGKRWAATCRYFVANAISPGFNLLQRLGPSSEAPIGLTEGDACSQSAAMAVLVSSAALPARPEGYHVGLQPGYAQTRDAVRLDRALPREIFFDGQPYGGNSSRLDGAPAQRRRPRLAPGTQRLVSRGQVCDANARQDSSPNKCTTSRSCT